MTARFTDKMGGGWLGRIGHDRLLRNFGWLGLGELFNRFSRIITTIILARYLGAIEFGIAATAVTCFELVRVFANNGLSQLVIKASKDRLTQTCNTAYRLTAIICVAMAIIQIVAGIIISWVTGRPELLAMIVCLAGVYFVMPGSMVQYWLLQREYRMGTVAGVEASQITTDNILTAVLAIAGLGAWAIVLPKLLTAPVWYFGMRRAISWRYSGKGGQEPWGRTIRFCLPILASEVLLALRGNLDNVLVGSILGLEALGIYFFAYNAGYGLSTVLTNALRSVSFRHLADPNAGLSGLVKRYDRAMFQLALPISAIIALQALAVPLYVPILFGEKWDHAITIVMVLCASAATRAGFDLAAQLLRAADLQTKEFFASTLFTFVMLASFAVALPFGLMTGVTVLCVGSLVMQGVFAIWARHAVSSQINKPTLHHDAQSEKVGSAADDNGSGRS